MNKTIAKIESFTTSPGLAEVKVRYENKDRTKTFIKSSQDAYNVFMTLFDQETIEYQEHFFLLLLSRSNRILGWVKVSQGGTSGTVVDPKIIFALALKTNASSIILGHNHPSGNNKPSEADISLTRKISEGAKLLEINLLDHLIIAIGEHYYSFADEGVI